METARVDIRKLQMLNDRINQTIDALNQVRLSVHSFSQLGQTTGVPFGVGGAWGAQGLGQYGVPAQVPGMIQGFGQGFGQAFGQNLNQGFAHTNPVNNPLAYAMIQNPLLAQLWGVNPLAAAQPGLGQIGQQVFGHTGLGHTSPESFVDPSAFGRIAQTFPFVQWGYSPYGQNYSPFAAGNTF